MTLHHEYEPNAFRPWSGEPINGVTHPRDIEQRWSADDLAAIDLYAAAPADDVPAGKIVMATSVQRVAGVVRYVHELADAPLPTIDDLKAFAAALRWQKETSGITVAGSSIDTTRESQALINGAYNLAKDDPETIIRFKSPAGFVTLDAPTMIAIGRAVGRHVQACFAKEANVVDAVEAGTITTMGQVEAEFV